MAAYLITTPEEDKQPSSVLAALHSVDGQRTVNGTGIILRVLEDRRNAGATPVPIVNDPPAGSSPPADATTPTPDVTTPVPPEQLVDDDGSIVSPGGTAPAPVTANGEVINSDNAKAKLGPTHLVDDPQPQAQDFCP